MPVIDSTTGRPIPSKSAPQTDTDGAPLYTIYYDENAPVQVVPNIQTGCFAIDGGGAYRDPNTQYTTLDGGNASSRP